MEMRVVGFLALLLSTALSGTATAQGRGGSGGGAGFHGAAGTAYAGGGNWHGDSTRWHGGGYYGGWHGYRGGWGGAYWGPSVGFYFGAPAYWGPWPYAYGYPYLYGYPPYSVSAPAIVVEQPVEVVTPPAQDNPGSAPAFWFYCTKPAGYYPYVRNCNDAWLRVVPQADTGTGSRPKLAQ